MNDLGCAPYFLISNPIICKTYSVFHPIKVYLHSLSSYNHLQYCKEKEEKDDYMDKMILLKEFLG